MAQVTIDTTTLFLAITVTSCAVMLLMYALYRDNIEETKNALQEAIMAGNRQRQENTNTLSVSQDPSYIDSGDPIENAIFVSSVQQLEDMQRMFHPLAPPLRRGHHGYMGFREHVVPGVGLPFNVNIPTRGHMDSFQQSGYLYNKDIPDQAMQLMGRRIHSNQYEYYTFHHNNPHIKIPLERQNKKEIFDGDEVPVPGYDKAFTVKIYKNDSPQYIPY